MTKNYYLSIPNNNFQKQIDLYKRLQRILQNKGYIDSRNILQKLLELHTALEKKEISKKEYMQSIFKTRKNAQSYIRTCSILIADTSVPSSTVGIDIGLAMSMNIPTIILRRQRKEDDAYEQVVPYMNKQVPNLYTFILKETNDIEKLPETISLLEENLEKERVHILLEKYINQYLQWKIKNSRFNNKTEIIKALILDQMAKDNRND